MKINPNRVNLYEEDVEEWLWKNPQRFYLGYPQFEKWIARQLHLPSGIADLVGVSNHGSLIVVELKNTTIRADALTQVMRYAHDLTRIMEQLQPGMEHIVFSAVVGKEPISYDIQFEANALGILLLTFDVQLDLDISGVWKFTHEYRKELQDKYREIASSDTFQELNNYIENKIFVDDVIQSARDAINDEETNIDE